ncbi:MAG: (Fe-S)-binding protein [Deltaproteobacteria bacterium]|nr:(Fe-S)-binding protein [Deltaproteobacteria bacterium]
MRVPYWNVDYGFLIDVLAVPVFAIFFSGLYSHYRKIRKGKEQLKLGWGKANVKKGPVFLKEVFTKSILGTRIYRKFYTGLAHGLVFSGMAILTLGTILVFANVTIKLPVFRGAFNHWFMSFGLDLAGISALAGLLFFFLRRLFPPDRLVTPKERTGFFPMIGLLALIIITGFLLESLRIRASGPEPASFVGNFVAGFIPANGPILSYHRYVWWFHGFIALGFIAYIPYSPMVHMVLAPVNTALADPRPGPKMGVIDFSGFDDEEGEDLPPMGVAKLGDFTRKRLLDFDTCLWCGRCHEVCPAAQTQRPLSPKMVVATLAEFLAANRFTDEPADVIGIDAIFNCTTCAACMEACPISINQPKAIMQLRQNLVMERSELPDLMSKAYNSLEQRRHPFFGTGAGPKDWQKGLDVPIFAAGKTEYLLWVGCAATYDERAQKIAGAMVKILSAATVSFGILAKPRCTGDPAKQMGNEFLFTEIARENIEEFDSLGIKKIITLCPHCFNSFTRHYPELGGHYEVIPHSVLISDLIAANRLTLNKNSESFCFHDPCYLARRNHIEQPPRRALEAMGTLMEMPRAKRESFCCGGGGGNYWSESTGIRINQVRAREALDTSSSLIATACPFCLLMLTDGVKKFTEDKKVFDIAELVEARLKLG